MRSELVIKEKQALTLIKSLDGLEPELAYSGGKDSDVILALAQMSGIKFHPIYKMTTIDPPGTEAHVKSKGVEIRKPNKTFFEIIQQNGFPTRRARFCCRVLKEYKIRDKAILGIRKHESAKRNKLYNEPSGCRIYADKSRCEQFYPILDWTNADVALFVNYYGIRCHQLYYGDDGEFDVSKRLGCMGCPLKSDNGKSDFIKYPKLVRQWIRNGKLFMQNHINARVHEKFGNVYDLFFHNIFCDSYNDYILKTRGLFGRLDCKQWLEDYFKTDL